MYIYIYIYKYIYIYGIHHWRIFEVVIESWPEWDFNSRPIPFRRSNWLNYQALSLTRTRTIYWSSQIPKQYKRIVITSDLNRAARIASDLSKIRYKFLYAYYPIRFINRMIEQFSQKSIVLLMKIPYCAKNEASSKRFIEKFDDFTESLYDIHVKWVTKKGSSYLELKVKIHNHHAYFKKLHVFLMKHALMRPGEILKQNGTSMKIIKKTKYQSNSWENIQDINFIGILYCLPELIITSVKSWKRQW